MKHGYGLDMESLDIKDEEIMSLCLSYCVFDMDRGLLLKLGENKEVLAALKGFDALSDWKIKEIYGSPVPTFKPLNWPKLNHLNNYSDDEFYFTFTNFFDSCKIPVLLRAVEVISAGKLRRSYSDIIYTMFRTIY